MKIYGYCRISTPLQNIERQERNIKAEYPEAHIVKETYTGTKLEGRKELDKIIKTAKAGDMIVFDSVSRMSRDAAEGVELYEKLFHDGISLVFLKEPHINTETYKNALNSGIETVGNEIADIYIEATNRVLMVLAGQQIRQAFEQSEKEVADLRQRTREGMETARLNGARIGQRRGAKLTTKKSIKAKQDILKHCRDFGGGLSDVDCIRLIGIAKNSYYKYKRELREAQ